MRVEIVILLFFTPHLSGEVRDGKMEKSKVKN